MCASALGKGILVTMAINPTHAVSVAIETETKHKLSLCAPWNNIS